MDKKIIIAIDGYSSCGKSTLAKDLAKALSYTYIDSGAMYRAITLYMIQNEIDVNDAEVVVANLDNIQLSFKYNEILDRNETYLNDRNVEELIRTPIVSQNVSEVSIIKEVRQFLVKQQRQMGDSKGIVMDGRDIGTVVFPEAEFKIFLTADVNTRAQRRYDEMLRKGITISLEEVKQNLEHRDNIDTHRAESPLYKADDAILLDNSILNRDQQFKLVLNMAKKIIENLNPKEENINSEEEMVD